MTTAAPPPAPLPSRTAPSAATRVLGIVLLLPALGVMVAQFVVPSVLTLVGSLQQVALSGGAGPFVGLDNYDRAIHLVPSGLGLTVALSVVAAIVGMLGGVIGVLAGRGGAVPRRITAAIAGVMLTLYAPVGMILAARTASDLMLESPVLAIIVLGLLAWLSPVLAGGVLGGLLTGRSGSTRTGAAVTSGLLGVVASGAVGLQSLVGSSVVNGPPMVSWTLQAAAFRMGFLEGQFGVGLAIETVVLLGLGLLGITATIILAASRLRLELTGPAPARGGAVGWVGLGLAVIALVAVLVVHRGWLAGLVAPASPGTPSDLTTTWMINTWGPALLLAVVQVVFSGLAGFGLGWMRPAGRGTAWLLLFFAPWLLVASSPLTLQHFLNAANLGLLRSPLVAVAPIWVSVPAMIAFSWLFGALGEAHRAAKQGARTGTTASGVLTGAAGTMLIGSLLWLTAAQSYPWRYATGTTPEQLAGPTALVQLFSSTHFSDPSGTALPQWISTPIPVLIVLAVVLSISAVLTTDRLALRMGKDPAPSTPPPVQDLGDGPTPEQAHASTPPAVPGRGHHGPAQG